MLEVNRYQGDTLEMWADEAYIKNGPLICAGRFCDKVLVY